MAGRPPLPLGTHGKIRTKVIGPKRVRAYCQFRDFDGVTKQYEETGPSEPAAERALKAKLAARTAATADITGDSKFTTTADRWYATILAAVADGERSPATAAAYRGLLDKHVLPAMGALRLKEITTGRVDTVLQAIKARSGAPTAKSARTVISGVLGWATRQDAVAINAARNTTPIPVKPGREPRALTIEEIARWLKRLAADPKAMRHDILDLCAFMIASGVRIGEALAVTWADIDLVGQEMVVDGTKKLGYTVTIDWTVYRVKGHPLTRKPAKTKSSHRTLRLPEFAVTVLRRRLVERYILAVGQLPTAGFEYVADSDVSAGQGVRDEGSEHYEDLSIHRPAADSEASTSGNAPEPGFEYFEHASGDTQLLVTALAHLADEPVFPDSKGGWRDPSNTRRDLRDARGEEFDWVTSHVFRKTAATLLDAAGLSARQIANVLGHSRPSMTQDRYLGRGVADSQAADALERGLSLVFGMDKPLADLDNQSQDTA